MTEIKEKTCSAGEVTTFTFNPTNQPIRVGLINQEPYFSAKDVCLSLGLANSSQAISKLDEDEKGVIIADTPGGKQELSAVTESGLYGLIFQSRKPEAKVFRKWVTGEVLPAIRKTGAYVVKSCGKSNYICRSTQWRYDNGLLPKTTIEERHGDFDDIRDIAFSYVEILNKPVRTVEYEDEDYFSIMDIKKALRITTDTSSIADSLCINKPFARKLFVFGSTSPAWFCTREGLRLLLSNKAKTNYCQYLDKLLKKGGM